MESQDKIEKARQAYDAMVQDELRLRRFRKIMTALPKKKLAKYEQVHADKLVRYRNSQSKFQSAVKELSGAEFAALHKAVYI
ncbi:MAG TPA: hypothetical protein VFL85_03165 [Candidatus Saccharimonadales bacterium]|nr:hypothetical protein [Candidatus Saccharimonadales bacterium]